MARRTRKRTKTPDYRDIEKEFQDVKDIKPEMKVVIYGAAGTGKTTLACSFPKPLLLIDCREKGTDSVRDIEGVTVLRAKDWQNIEDAYWYLMKEDHGFKTVIVDTVSQAQELCIKRILEDKGKDLEEGALGNWGTMTKQDWGAASTKLKTFIIAMRDIDDDLDVVFIGHDRVFNADDDDEDNAIAPSVGPRVMPSVAAILNASVSIIANTFIRETFHKRKVGKRTKTKRAVEYCLRVGPHAYYTTKIRKPKKTVLPDILVDADYSDLLSYASGEE